MKCPSCGCDDDRVIDSRTTREGRVVRRRRHCEECSTRFTTYEYIEPFASMVVKKDGRREPFDRQKMAGGILTACQKRPVSPDRIDQLVDRVEARIGERGEREIPSEVVGQLVMEELQEVDQVAYVRFASVYRHFKDVGEFLEEIRSMLK